MVVSSYWAARRRTRATVSSLVVIAPLPRFGSATVTWVVAVPCQADQRVAGDGLPVDGQGDLADHRADQLLALAVGGGRGVEDGADVGAGPVQPGQFLAGQPDRVPGAGGGQVGLGAAQGGQALLEPGLQGAGDQPVARLDLVVLAQRPVGFEPGPLGRESRTRSPGRGAAARRRPSPARWPPARRRPAPGTAARARRGAGAPRRCSGTAGCHTGGCRGRTGTGARPAVPGVADLHHPAALAAPEQAGQQRRALAGGAAAVPARRLAVGPQPGLDVLPGVPVQVAGVVAGDQHLPLVLRQHPLGAGSPSPDASTRFSVRVRPNTYAPA